MQPVSVFTISRGLDDRQWGFTEETATSLLNPTLARPQALPTRPQKGDQHSLKRPSLFWILTIVGVGLWAAQFIFYWNAASAGDVASTVDVIYGIVLTMLWITCSMVLADRVPRPRWWFILLGPFGLLYLSGPSIATTILCYTVMIISLVYIPMIATSFYGARVVLTIALFAGYAAINTLGEYNKHSKVVLHTHEPLVSPLVIAFSPFLMPLAYMFWFRIWVLTKMAS